MSRYDLVKAIGALVGAGIMFAIARGSQHFQVSAPSRPAAPGPAAPVYHAPVGYRGPIVRSPIVSVHPPRVVVSRGPVITRRIGGGRVSVSHPPVLHLGFGGSPVTRLRHLYV